MWCYPWEHLKCYPIHVHIRMDNLWKTNVSSLENITRFKMEKQNKEAKKVYYYKLNYLVGLGDTGDQVARTWQGICWVCLSMIGMLHGKNVAKVSCMNLRVHGRRLCPDISFIWGHCDFVSATCSRYKSVFARHLVAVNRRCQMSLQLTPGVF